MGDQIVASLTAVFTAPQAPGAATPAAQGRPVGADRPSSAQASEDKQAGSADASKQMATLTQYCVSCHNDRTKTAGVSFQGMTPETVGQHAELFEKDAALIASEKRHFVFRYRSPEHWLAVFRGFYGPVLKAFDATDADRRIELQQEMLALADRFNRADDGTMVVPGEYLQVVITRP